MVMTKHDVIPGDVVKDKVNGILYNVMAVHPMRDEIRVVRRSPRNDVRRKLPVQFGHYKPASRFEVAICQE